MALIAFGLAWIVFDFAVNGSAYRGTRYQWLNDYPAFVRSAFFIPPMVTAASFSWWWARTRVFRSQYIELTREALTVSYLTTGSPFRGCRSAGSIHNEMVSRSLRRASARTASTVRNNRSQPPRLSAAARTSRRRLCGTGRATQGAVLDRLMTRCAAPFREAHGALSLQSATTRADPPRESGWKGNVLMMALPHSPGQADSKRQTFNRSPLQCHECTKLVGAATKACSAAAAATQPTAPAVAPDGPIGMRWPPLSPHCQRRCAIEQI
jgi:hypothetical protein